MTFNLERELRFHDAEVQLHGTESAMEQLRRDQPERADEILAEYTKRIGEIVEAPRGLTSEELEGWYFPNPTRPRWRWARSRMDLPDHVLDHTSDTADEILGRLANPERENIRTRGLVLGHVQSGKTTNYLAVAAKAADVGYTMIIILAGVHNSLRRQTQDRAERTLIHKQDLWWSGTGTRDFYEDKNSLGSHLNGHGKRGLLVVKKNARVLERLADWLEKTPDSVLRKNAVLVIDDEADQAGLDVSHDDTRRGVHKQLRRIVDLQTRDGDRRCAYLAYTATPYANILTSQEEFGLYPRDFIYPLDKPSGHIGADELFGDSRIGQPIRIETDADTDTDDPNEILTPALEDAIRWFVLATAARVALSGSLESFHSSMLIHTTQSTEDQLQYRPVVERYLCGIRSEFDDDPSSLRAHYEDLLADVPARPGGGNGVVDERTASWNEVRPHIREVLDRLIDRTPSGAEFVEDGKAQRAHSGVIVDNSRVPWKDRLTYSDIENGEPSVTVIVIGGNTMSRGLTLEGLVCSYFARTAGTYDSLMQMGRWFGFRPGYRHLVRLWTTDYLLERFGELNEVEKELREELQWMESRDQSPERYGPRIRVLPNLNITRSSAMQSVRRQISFSDTRIDPAKVDLDPDALTGNQRCARQLAEEIGAWQDPTDRFVFRDVPAEHVQRFLERYRFHPSEPRVDRPSLERYLTSQAGSLRRWNVLFRSIRQTSNEQFDYGGAVGVVNAISRSRIPDRDLATIGSLVDSGDHRIDMGGCAPNDGSRYRAADEPPLLLIYALDPVGTPRRGESNRVPLGAPTPPIGVAIALPRSDANVEYVSPALPATDRLSSAADLGDHEDA